MTNDLENSQLSLAARLEALLFISGEPVELTALAAALQVDIDSIESALASLRQSLQGHGLTIIKHGSTAQMTTAGAVAADVQRYLHAEQETSLSAAALETLAVLAYRQPATRAQVEAIRGVSCESPLRTLLRLGLVTELDRLDQPGRPIAYGTTAEFLRVFGLNDLSDLPPLPESN